jgi:hypothetical protein
MRFVYLLLLAACAEHEPTRVFVASTTQPAPTQSVPSPTKTPGNCDDAIVAYHELLASGKGPNHPSVLAAKVVYDACNSGSPPPGMQLHRSPSPPMSCGEAALERAKLLALGKGPNHPALMVVEERLRHCPTATPSADECNAVAREHADLEARGYGPRHPDMMASDAKRALCP